jgi:hypothetical protein
MRDPIARTNKVRGIVGALAFGLTLSACTVGPDHHRPDIDVPPAWRLGTTEAEEISNAEQSLLNAQLALVTAQSQYFQSYANLYKAMGGGWVGEAEALVPKGVADSTGSK